MTQEDKIIKKRKERIQRQAKELEKLYAVRANECINSFYEFFVEFWDILNLDTELTINWHHKFLCDYLQSQVERAFQKLPKEHDTVINIPPGMTKSSIVSQSLGAWCWLHAPNWVIILSTNSNDLSVEHSLKSKDIVKSDRYNKYFQPHFQKKWGKFMFLTKDNEKDWRNNFGGIRLHTSVTGSVIGKHAHLILWDDLIDVENANSEKVRNRANRHLSKTLPTRKKDKEVTPTIGIMQRLHEDDPTGHILEKSKNIYHIKLPARVSGDVQPPELKIHYTNGLLDPNRLNESILQEQEELLGQYDFAGQFDQEPTPKGGGKVKEAWFMYCEDVDVPKDVVWDLWIDGAYTKNTSNDPTGLAVMGYSRRTKKLYVRNAKDAFMEMPELLKEVPRVGDIYGLNNRSRAYIEPKASGHSLKQMLSDETDLSAILIEGKLVSDGKDARLAVLSPKVESSRVVLVKGNWNDNFVAQITTYPRHKNDEYVDLLGYACDEYFRTSKSKGVQKLN